jgi:hypothetical protein
MAHQIVEIQNQLNTSRESQEIATIYPWYFWMILLATIGSSCIFSICNIIKIIQLRPHLENMPLSDQDKYQNYIANTHKILDDIAITDENLQKHLFLNNQAK